MGSPKHRHTIEGGQKRERNRLQGIEVKLDTIYTVTAMVSFAVTLRSPFFRVKRGMPPLMERHNR